MAKADTLAIQNFGPIKSAELEFGDLTVFVGPQASGKSIALQLLKLLVDRLQIQNELRRYGLDWSSDISKFLEIYFGEGMKSLWSAGSSAIRWQGENVDLQALAKPRRSERQESVFFIPAQRVLALRDGWPRPFTDYQPGDPFVVREFSERLRILMENEMGRDGTVFPEIRRLPEPFRKRLSADVFAGFSLRVDRERMQKRLILRGAEQQSLPFMVWSAGQREFIPLLLGLYWLMPRSAVTKRKEITWVVLEELESGLHPRAITDVVLLVLVLLQRGYRVCLSTHSTQVLDALWALKNLRDHNARPEDLLQAFDAKWAGVDFAKRALSATVKVHAFSRAGGITTDISELSVEGDGADWGGLTEFSSRINEAVTKAAGMDETT